MFFDNVVNTMNDKINLTPEQLAEDKAFFQQNDFTANMAVEREYNMTGDKAKAFARSKKIFGEYWLGNLPGLTSLTNEHGR